MADLSSKSVVVFDFDHTLTTFDTGSAFFAWLLKRDIWRILLLALMLPLLLPLVILRRTRKLFVRAAVWVGTLGRSQHDIDLLCDKFANERIKSGNTIFHRDGLARLRLHESQGHTVVIATGTLSALATALLKRAAIADVIVVGSSMRHFLFGMIAHEHCYGQQKVRMLEQRGFTAPWSAAYTDHESDFWLLEKSRERYLVNPKPKATAAFELKFNAKPSILRWE